MWMINYTMVLILDGNSDPVAHAGTKISFSVEKKKSFIVCPGSSYPILYSNLLYKMG